MKKKTKKKTGYGYDMKLFEPIDKDDAIRFVQRWRNEAPVTKIIYSEFTISDVLNLFGRNILKLPTHVRIYNAINDAGEHTHILVTSRITSTKKGKTTEKITKEIDAGDNDYGEDFGTLSPPAGDIAIDDTSLAALSLKKAIVKKKITRK
jgi:hypothetical protein